MNRITLIVFAIGVLIALYGLYSLVASGEGFLFIFGGIVITAIAAGIFGKTHAKGSNDAG
ncbi:hypothetical protein [Qipengyuania nanhaisediminis]|uniref:hypothetical protein n=1 Tax=Qipengyuania nanhaisediminis TaxID=604088 RepID=UPI0038B2BBBE